MVPAKKIPFFLSFKIEAVIKTTCVLQFFNYENIINTYCKYRDDDVQDVGIYCISIWSIILKMMVRMMTRKRKYFERKFNMRVILYIVIGK